MKKRFFTVVALLVGVLLVSPINGNVEGNTNINNNELENQMYVNSNSTESTKSDVVLTDEDRDIKDIDDNNVVEQPVKESNVVSNTQSSLPNNRVQKDNIEKVVVEDKNNEEVKNPVDEQSVVKEEQPVVNETKKSLTKEEALAQITNKNDKMTYNYMGDENDFNVLKEKGHEGYVYLPNTDTDLGIFVDKNTQEMFYFHPSGYLDIYE